MFCVRKVSVQTPEGHLGHRDNVFSQQTVWDLQKFFLVFRHQVVLQHWASATLVTC